MERRKSHFPIVRRAQIAPLVRGAARPRPRILSVTYDPSLAKTRELLFAGAGMTVTTSMDIAQAVHACRTGRFDLVLVGHSIPLEHSQALLRQVRNLGSTPVLALTRLGQSPLSGADYWFDSSESPAALLARVEEILENNERKV